MQQDAWKDKYLKAVEQFEHQEKAWETLTESLRRGLVRVCIAAEGTDPNLDEGLARLKQAVKETRQTHDLDSLIETITQHSAHVEQHRKARAKALLTSLEMLLMTLEVMQLPESVKSSLAPLKDRISKAPPEITELGPFLQSYANCLEEALKAFSSESPQAQQQAGTFWSTWFGKSTVKASDSATETRVYEIDPEAFKSIILELLHYLPLTSSHGQSIKALEQQLEVSESLGDILNLLKAITQILSQSVVEEQKQFEQFLLTLTHQLDSIHRYLEDGSSDRAQARANQNAFDEDIQKQVQGLESSMADVQSLDQLKTMVSSSIATLVARMDEFKAEENERLTKAETKAEALEADMMRSQTQLAKLQEKLNEQTERATTDPLTKLPNRQAYEDRLEIEVARWQRYQTPLTMVVTDIDRFKQLNDNFGHLAGDKVLRIVANKLKEHIREADFIARFGGEEFVILMPETAKAQAKAVADKLRAEVAAIGFHFNGESITVTMSFGVSEFQKGEDAQHVFERADKALYAAKDQGRNQVCVA